MDKTGLTMSIQWTRNHTGSEKNERKPWDNPGWPWWPMQGYLVWTPAAGRKNILVIWVVNWKSLIHNTFCMVGVVTCIHFHPIKCFINPFNICKVPKLLWNQLSHAWTCRTLTMCFFRISGEELLKSFKNPIQSNFTNACLPEMLSMSERTEDCKVNFWCTNVQRVNKSCKMLIKKSFKENDDIPLVKIPAQIKSNSGLS